MRRTTVLSVTILSGLLFVQSAIAANPAPAPSGSAPTSFEIKNPIGSNDLAGLIKVLTDAIRNLAIPVAVVMILWAGFNYLTSAGKPEKYQKANKILMYTAIGLAVIFIGGGFVDLIKSVLNIGQ